MKGTHPKGKTKKSKEGGEGGGGRRKGGGGGEGEGEGTGTGGTGGGEGLGWMDQMSAPAQALADPGTAWWQMTTDNPASSLIDGGVDQLQRSLSQDPTLRSIDQMWNANPLREVVPVDWAEIARALRTFGCAR